MGFVCISVTLWPPPFRQSAFLHQLWPLWSPSGKSPGLRVPCKAPTRQGKHAIRNIRRCKWPTYVGKTLASRSTSLGLGRFAKLFRDRRIRAAFADAKAMPAPSFSLSRPFEAGGLSRPSIPTSPGRCPLHQEQSGWNMPLPCEACIALAFSES